MKISYLSIIVLSAILLISCDLGPIFTSLPIGQSSSNQQAILGRWKPVSATNLATSNEFQVPVVLGVESSLEFFKDGTIIYSLFSATPTSTPAATLSASFSFSDDTHMKTIWTSANGYPAQMFGPFPSAPILSTVSVSSDQLIVTENVLQNGLGLCIPVVTYVGPRLAQDGVNPSTGKASIACQYTRIK